MFDQSTHTTSPQSRSLRRTLRTRSGGFLAAAAALAVAITGSTAPAAQAVLQPGDWVLVSQIDGSAPLNPMTTPHGVAVDQNTGDIYVTDRGTHELLKFDSTGKPIFRRGAQGAENGFFNIPTGVAVDKKGDVYVVDTGNDRIQKFNSEGAFIAKWGEIGAGNGQFDSPVGIFAAPFGRILVADTGNSRIQKFNADGTYNGKWGALGQGQKQFNGPQAIAADAVGNFVVADTLNHRIQAFDDGGTFLREWGKQGSVIGEFDAPSGIAVDQSNNVYVADSQNDRIQQFNQNGVSKSVWTTQFSPRNIAVDSTSGKVFVTEGNSVRVYKQAVSPSFAVGLNATATVGKSYISQVQTAGVPAVPLVEMVEGKLPAGLKFTSGILHGFPMVPGTFKVKLKADNNVAGPATAEYTVAVAKAPSRLGVKTKTTTSKRGVVTIKATITLSAPGTIGLGGSRTGKIQVNYGGKVVKTIPVTAAHKGMVKVTLPKFNKKKRKTITLRYLGNTQLAPSKRIVGKAVTKLSTKFSTKAPKVRGTNVKATIKLSVPYTTGLSKTGKVRVYYGKKLVKTVALKTTNMGTVRATLPKFKKVGTTKVTLKYLGNKQLRSSKRVIYVRVR